MHILMLGKYGQLGWELSRTLAPLGVVSAYDFPDIDLRQPEQARALVQQLVPDLIVNATAYTAVDRAESEVETALAINGSAPGVLAEEARRLGIGLIHFSTDYVFDGTMGRPYTEVDLPNPVNVYGESKLAGEQAIQAVDDRYMIFRTSWVYSLRRSSFVTKVLGWARANDTLRIVDDQISNPTWARMLAEITALWIASGGDDLTGRIGQQRGIYHLAGSGHASRLDWARAILKYDPNPEEQRAKTLLPAASSDFPTPAVRPLYSALNCERFTEAFGLQLPNWEDTLRLAMDPEA